MNKRGSIAWFMLVALIGLGGMLFFTWQYGQAEGAAVYARTTNSIQKDFYACQDYCMMTYMGNARQNCYKSCAQMARYPPEVPVFYRGV